MNDFLRFALIVLQVSVAVAQEQPSTSIALPDGPLRVEVVEVVGPVRFISGGAPPAKVTVGQLLAEGDEIVTFPRCRVTMKIEPDQTLTLDRVGRLKLDKARIADGSITAELGMTYGRMRYTIEGAERRYDVNLKAPNSTLGIRGTDVVLYDQPPYPPQATSLEGRARFRDARRQLQLGGTSTAQIGGNANSAAESAVAQTVIDPTIRAARTESEQQLVNRVLSNGSTVTFDPIRGIDVVTGGVPPTINQLAANPPGAVNFVLTWPGNANIDTQWSTFGSTEFSDTIIPFAGLNIGKSGGKIDFDHRGGSAGGFEIVYFPGVVPADGDFLVSGSHVSGTTTNVNIGIIVNGRILDSGAFLDPVLDSRPSQPVGPAGSGQNPSALFLIRGDVVRGAAPAATPATAAKKKR
jgi:hypothetical protein